MPDVEDEEPPQKTEDEVINEQIFTFDQFEQVCLFRPIDLLIFDSVRPRAAEIRASGRNTDIIGVSCPVQGLHVPRADEAGRQPDA